jgi:methionine-rich copper-binding protein CopC
MRRPAGAALAALVTGLMVPGPAPQAAARETPAPQAAARETPAPQAAARETPAASVPADDAVLPAMPAEVTVTFGREPVAAGSHLSVLDPDGSRINLAGMPAVEGRTISQPTSSHRTGVFAIVYHVVFADGGREGGLRHFTVDPAAGPHSGDAHAHGPQQAHGHSVDPFSAVLLIADGVVALGAVVLLTSRRRHPGPVAWRLPESERTFDDQPT